MKKTRVLFVVLLALFVGFLTACTSTEDLLNAAKDELVAHYSETISVEDYEVTSNLTLLETIGDATVSWTSSNTAAITAAGVVTRLEVDTVVTLTATLTIEGETVTQQFRVKVKAVEVTVAQRLALAKAQLVTNYAATIGDDEYEVTANLTLATTVLDATVSWSSNEPTIITNAGVVTRPTFATGDQTVTLTATLTIGTQTTTQVFYAFVPALAKTVNETLREVLDVVTTFPTVDGITGAEDWLDFLTTFTYETVAYTVAWTSDKPDFLSVDGTVTRPALGEDDELVTLTASITLGDVTETKEVQFLVFAIESSTTLDSIGDVYDEEELTYVRFEGVTVIGKMQGGFFISDGDTVLFVYDSSVLYNTVVVGQTYDIEGVYALYFGSPQLASEAARPLTAVASDALPVSLTGSTATVVSATADKPKPSASYIMVYDYISVTAKVQVDNQETADVFGGVRRYNTFLVPTDFEGTQVIKTVNSIGKATEYNTPAIIIYYQSLQKAAVTALDGEEVTINVLLYGWRTDRNIWYAIYLGDGTDIEVNFATDADAVAAVKESLGSDFPLAATTATTMNLLTAQYGATISWASSHEALINPTTGAVTPVEGSQTTVTLTATITKGLETDTKVFTIKVGQVPLSTVLEVRTAAVNDLVRFNGLLLMGDNNRTFVVHDATAAVMLFTADAALLTQLNANLGKEVTIEGTRSVTSGQMVQVTNFTVTVLGDAVNVPLKLDYTGLSLLADDMLPYQGYLMSYEGLMVVSVTTTTPSNNTTVVLRNLQNQTISIFHSNFAVVPALEVAYLKALTPGTVVNIVDGIVGWFNNPQFYYTGQAQVVTVTNISDEHKVYFDHQALTQTLAYTEATTLTLPATGTNGSTITWASSDEALINPTTGAVVMPVSGQVTVTLTATVAIGEVSRTKQFEVVLGTAEPTETLVLKHEFNFGTSAVSGYASGSWMLTDMVTSQEFTVTKFGAQLTQSSNAPHTSGNIFMAIQGKSGDAGTANATFNLGATVAKEVKFDVSIWSAADFGRISQLTSIELQAKVGEDWVRVVEFKSVINATEYNTVTGTLDGASEFRFLAIQDGTGDVRVVIDNVRFFG